MDFVQIKELLSIILQRASWGILAVLSLTVLGTIIYAISTLKKMNPADSNQKMLEMLSEHSKENANRMFAQTENFMEQLRIQSDRTSAELRAQSDRHNDNLNRAMDNHIGWQREQSKQQSEVLQANTQAFDKVANSLDNMQTLLLAMPNEIEKAVERGIKSATKC